LSVDKKEVIFDSLAKNMHKKRGRLHQSSVGLVVIRVLFTEIGHNNKIKTND